jgi:hypothetical protein
MAMQGDKSGSTEDVKEICGTSVKMDRQAFSKFCHENSLLPDRAMLPSFSDEYYADAAGAIFSKFSHNQQHINAQELDAALDHIAELRVSRGLRANVVEGPMPNSILNSVKAIADDHAIRKASAPQPSTSARKRASSMPGIVSALPLPGGQLKHSSSAPADLPRISQFCLRRRNALLSAWRPKQSPPTAEKSQSKPQIPNVHSVCTPGLSSQRGTRSRDVLHSLWQTIPSRKSRLCQPLFGRRDLAKKDGRPC